MFFGKTGKIDDLLPTMVKHKTEKYLVPLSSVHNDDVKNLLDSKHLKHKECVMYRTVSNDFTDEEKKNFDYDMLVFFSPTGVRALLKNFPDFKQGDIKIAAFGPATAREIDAQGLRLDLQAPSKRIPVDGNGLGELSEGGEVTASRRRCRRPRQYSIMIHPR